MIALIILSFTSILVFFIVSKIQKATEDTATPDESSEGVCKIQSPKGLFSNFAETVFFGLLHLVFGLVFCSLWFLWVWVYWGREKREKERSAVILRSASFSFCLCLLHCIPSNESFCRTLRVRSLFLPVLYRIQRVLAFRLWAQRGRLKFLNDHLRIFLCINRGSI